ncbi:coth protein-domain-containing protein [Parasitella parasitica]|nr:coth protein-domain-containing protein [Parasitella parasitica]
MIFKRIASSALLLASLASARQQNITYSVIAAPETSSMLVAVVVDDMRYPLVATPNDGGLLYQGQAPVAQSGYHYAIVDQSQQIAVSEPFSRTPVQDQKTYNEFFNRTMNVYNVELLPQIMDPISVINRIQSDLHIYDQIPTIHLWGNTTAIQALNGNQLDGDLDVELNMTYYSLDKVKTFQNVKVSVAGRSSRYITKLSYNIKMKKKSKDMLFGFKKFKLRAMGYDASYIRERVAFATLKSVGVPCTEYSYIRVFLNNKPAGFYGIIETFQDPWLANEFANGDENYKSGYLYQGQAFSLTQTEFYGSDLSYYGNNMTLYSLGQYKIKAGTKSDAVPDDYKELRDFTKFVNETTSATSVEEWNRKLETDGFIRAMAIEDLLGFSDAYMTMADNFYVYSEPESKRMIYMPADLDTSIGSSIFLKSYMLEGNYSNHPGFELRPLTKKLFANQEFLKHYQGLLLKFSETLINPTVMNPFIDSLVGMIYPDVEWDQSLIRLGYTYTNLTLENISSLPGVDNFFPPGFDMEHATSPSNQTFHDSVGGTINSTSQQSVKQFIANKSANVIAFYNKNPNTAL